MAKKTIECKVCGKEIAKSAKACPECGAKNKKPLYKKWWFWLIIVIILFSVAGGGGNETDEPVKAGIEEQDQSGNSVQTDASVTAHEETTASAQTAFYVGDTLQDGDMKIVYMSSGEYAEQNVYSQPANGYKYIYLQFAFENTSRSNDTSISEYSFECYADGYSADMYYGGEESLSATLSAGRMTTGFIYFTVPVDAEVIEIEYSPNIFLEKKITFVYEGEKDSGYTPIVNARANPDAHKVGDVVESGGLRITYISCEEYKSANQFVKPKDGYRYVSCEFEFENLGDADAYVSSFDFDCFADGVSCDACYIRDDDLSATLSSGRKTKGTVTFEVPVDAVVIEVEYLSNYWTSNRVAFTVQ